MSKNIQIPEEMFIDVIELVDALQNYELDKDTNLIVKRLETALNAKIEAMQKRNTFIAYKTAKPGSVQRELKRQEYLEQAAIKADWRSHKEIIS